MVQIHKSCNCVQHMNKLLQYNPTQLLIQVATMDQVNDTEKEVFLLLIHDVNE